MEVRALSKWFFFFIFFSLGVQKSPIIQRGIINEHNAIIYKNYDFDSKQIVRLPRNKIVVISTKIYRPQNLFGSFYKVYLNKPQKIRGYISEVDIIPQYKRSQSGVDLNEAYQERENILKQIKPRKDSSSPELEKSEKSGKNSVENSVKKSGKNSVEKAVKKESKKPTPQKQEKSVKESVKKSVKESVKKSVKRGDSERLQKNAIGFSLGWMSPLFEEEQYGVTPILGGLRWLGLIPLGSGYLPFDTHIAVSPLAPYEVRGSSLNSGFILDGQFFPLWEGFESMSLGAGLAWKYESSLQLSESEFNLGLGVSLNFILNLTQTLFGRFTSEYKYYFGEGEKPGVNFWVGIFYKV